MGTFAGDAPANCFSPEGGALVTYPLVPSCRKRDLELMRVTMMEKIEIPFRAKCDMLARVRQRCCCVFRSSCSRYKPGDIFSTP